MRLLMSVAAVSLVALALSATPALAKEHTEKDKQHKHPTTAPTTQSADKQHNHSAPTTQSVNKQHDHGQHDAAKPHDTKQNPDKH